VRALKAQAQLSFKIIHTGQHYDRDMNAVFFDELGIPEPDLFMAAGGGSHAEQTGKIMVGFEALCTGARPDAVVGEVCRMAALLLAWPSPVLNARVSS
jgi:UDP-N-acetylglucosamine 2-epimerase (non-hydrolysing)